MKTTRIAVYVTALALVLPVIAPGAASALDDNPDHAASIGLGINLGTSSLGYIPDKTASTTVTDTNKYGGGLLDIYLDGRFPLSKRMTLTTGIILKTEGLETGGTVTPTRRYEYGAIVVNFGIRFYIGN